MTDLVLAALIAATPGTLGVIVSLINSHNLKRLERNTNSISERNEAIAKKLGMVEGAAAEKANPSA